MNSRSYSFLFSVFTLLLTATPSKAFDAPDEKLLAFCSNVRDEYISTTKKRYESQRYQGAGSANAGISAKDGIHFGGDGSYDWQRTWDNLDDTKKHEYTSKNCDVALQQWGRVSVAEIQADAQKAISRMQLEASKYDADTRALIANINLESVKDTNRTNASIANINANANVAVTGINANAAIQNSNNGLAAVQNTNQTNLGIAEINASTAMNNSNNGLTAVQNTNQTNLGIVGINANANVDIAKTQATTANKQSSNQLIGGIVGVIGNVVGTSIASSGNGNQQKVAADVEKERIRAQIEIAKLNAQTEHMRIAAANGGNLAADQLLAEWGWTKVTCYPGAAFITGMSNDTICVNPNTSVLAGYYRYDRATNQLMPTSSATDSVPTQPSTNSVPVQATDSQSTGGF